MKSKMRFRQSTLNVWWLKSGKYLAKNLAEKKQKHCTGWLRRLVVILQWNSSESSFFLDYFYRILDCVESLTFIFLLMVSCYCWWHYLNCLCHVMKWHFRKWCSSTCYWWLRLNEEYHPAEYCANLGHNFSIC